MCDKIRVGLIDDQDLVRSGFSMVIDSQDDMCTVLEASHGKQALDRLALVPVDVVLMDIRMPGMDGLETTERINQMEFPHGVRPKVIILTTFDLDEYVMRAIRGGASGFLLKDAPPDQMLSSIRTVHRGDAVIAPSSTKRLVSYIAQKAVEDRALRPQIVDVLTEREREVLYHMAKGLSNTEIGEELDVAQATIKTHVGRIFAKLGARDRVQAVVLAYEAGLVRPGDLG
ncbi:MULTISPECIES: response regulator [Trueperella]|uniref:Oxygen regulatory protein NreC n=1 Tax=Trueperella bernardiae TaxID=59561 RepID=A0A0W1KLE2_9ACTO|nr:MULTISPECIES: response regulator transcription factor [Trueperella]KTF04425.1 Oxygen regulatory protein NreC [Trueperella bernardiae]MCM3906864.1 response regulator transcription factor [Trueperella bernardiae]MDK8602217.1 response regulator transcription factor [Trueperella bernardiae]MDV6238741.1 response regulator transcription factor [Trueperella bernardiae]OCW60820.1 LuxR family transcriptional regulator [Trueperella bernardiae]